VVTFTPWSLYYQGKSPQYPLDRRLGGPQNRSECSDEEKKLHHRPCQESSASRNTRRGYEVQGMILLQASYLYTDSLLIAVTFEVLPISSYALSQTMLRLLKTLFEFL
jgi:hypothetical protein